MNLLIQFVAVLLISLTTANPVQLSKKSLTINQVLRPRLLSNSITPHRGIASYARALGKYGGAGAKVRHLSALAMKYGHMSSPAEQAGIHSSSSRDIPSAISSSYKEHENVAQDPPAASPKVAGPITAVPGPYDASYTSQITIGDRNFYMDFDTGSSDLWVFGPNITGLAPNQTKWHPSSTSTKLAGYYFYIQYGDGSYASGGVWKDNITIGSVKVFKTAVEVAEFAGGRYDAPSSGILGLGFDKNNAVLPNQQKTIFTDLIEQGLISSPVFCSDLKHNAPGCYTFGEIPWWQHSGAITYAPADSSDGYWTLTPLGFGVSRNASIGLNTSTTTTQLLRGVVDTGSTLIVMNDEIASTYWKQVPSAILDFAFFGGYIFDCNETLPPFKLLVGEKGKATYTLTVPGDYMSYAPLGAGTCYGAMQPTFGQIPFNIYGDVFLKSAFVVFDRGSNGQSPRLGFADKGMY